jgi:cytochrome c biogenesis protein CcmG, thiol:disulfide interchange protein DsbE
MKGFGFAPATTQSVSTRKTWMRTPGARFSSPGYLKRLAYGEPDRRIVIIELRPLRPTPRFALALALPVALLAVGCGAASGGDYGGQHPDYAKALAGSPAPLAALHRQADRLLPGGGEAFERRIAALRGYPAVVNVWASWCGPCRFEFPRFQQAAARYGRRVAFLGIDSQDSDDAAGTFLEEAPVPYPSYTDPDQKIAESVGAGLGLPDTAFYDSGGNLVHLKQGPYRDAEELRADIERYALGGGGEGG